MNPNVWQEGFSGIVALIARPFGKGAADSKRNRAKAAELLFVLSFVFGKKFMSMIITALGRLFI